MTGKPARERHALGPLAQDRALPLVSEMLASHAQPIVQVRAQDARMVACLVVRANEATVRLCDSLGFRMRLGGTGVFGLLGADAARLFAPWPPDQQAWLEAPCGPRETKVLLLAGGIALFSLEARDGKVVVTAVAGST
jgi:hypothetical protein